MIQNLKLPFFKVFGLFVALNLIVSLSSPAYSAQNSVDLNNLPKQLASKILENFPNIQKQELKPSDSDQLIQWLHTDPEVEQVRIEAINPSDSSQGYKLEIKRPIKVAKLEIAGSQSLKTSDLKELLKIREGDRFVEETLLENAEIIRNHYKSQGWMSPVIDLKVDDIDFSNKKITFYVQEGPRTYLSKVDIQTSNEALKNSLTKLLKSYLKKPLTPELITEIQNESREWLSKKSYFRTELKNPQTQFNSNETEATLVYSIDKADKYTVVFNGQRQLSTSQLEDVLDLKNYYTSNPALASDISNKIQMEYLARGFARAEVSAVELGTKDDFTKKIDVQISEGARIKILAVKVTGRTTHTEKWYFEFLKEHSSELIQDGFYAKEDLDAGLKNLILQLQNEGHLTAKLVSSRIQYNDKKTGITLHLNMDEGPLTLVDSIQFYGNASFSNEELIKLVNLKVGEPLLLDNIEQALNALRSKYQNNGFIEMSFQNEKEDLVAYNDDNTRARLLFKIYEGPQVTLGNIVIDGNSFTKTDVILSEIDLKDGELLTNKKIADITARLQRSGYFASVEVKTLEEKTQVAKRTLLVKVRERDPGLFVMGTGANNERILTLKGYAGIAYRNIFGTGRGISLRLEGRYNVADVKYLENTITLGYLEPHLFMNRLRGRINVSRSLAVTDYDLRKVTQTNQTTYSVEREFTPNVTGLYEVWSLATLKDFGIDPSKPVTTSLLDIATTGPTLDIDYRDNAFNPTRGYYARLKAEYSAPVIGSTRTIEYYKATASYTHYIPVKSLVFANNFQIGYLENLSHESDGGVPFNKKGFILGGRSTVRGFESGTSEVFPNTTDLGSDNYMLTGHSTMSLIKSELRFPIYGNFAGAVFYDGGTVTVSGLKFADSYRDSAGLGFRYITPFGPLNIELAWKLDAKPTEEKMRYHLSIGTF